MSRKKKQTEFSKKILATAKWECWIITAAGIGFAWKGIDTSIFAYVIPVCWGGYAIARAFYYNKAKAENAIKLRKAYKEAGLDPDPADEEFNEAMDEKIQSDY
jgi:hypothetical protein